jgi:hypothetical protein
MSGVTIIAAVRLMEEEEEEGSSHGMHKYKKMTIFVFLYS